MSAYLKINDPDAVSALDELSLWSAPFGLKLLERVIYRKKMNVLDIGYGTGFPLTELAMRLGKTSKIYGVDPWNEGAERAKMKIRTFGLENVEILNIKAEELPFSDNYFDLIVSNNGLNNVDDLRRTIAECSRVIKKEGQMVFTYNSNETMKDFYDLFEKTLADNNLNKRISLLNEYINHNRKPLEIYESHLLSYGFRIKDLKKDSFNFRYADGTSLLSHFFIRIAFLDKWMEIAGDENSEKVITALENRLNAMAEENNGLVFNIPFYTFDCRKL